MENKEQIFERIDRYINGNMSGEESVAFEKELESNPELRSEYRLHEAAHNLVLERRLQKIRDKSHIHATSDTKSGKTLVYGTALLLTLTLTGIVVFYTTSTDPEPRMDLANDSIVMGEVKEEKIDESDLPVIRQKLVSQDSSAYDTLVKEVKDRDTKNVSRVDVIYEEVNDVYQADSIAEQLYRDHEDMQKLGSPSDSLFDEKPSVEKVKPDPCANIPIDYKISTTKTCIDEKKGSVSIQLNKGNINDFELNIQNESGERAINKRLSAGSYTIYLTDDGCKTKTKNFTIKEELCLKDYLINTSYSETLDLPAIDGGYTFMVYSKTGDLYYKKQVDENESLNWNAQNNQGEIIAGYYLIKVTTTNGEVKKGSVTIKN